ncbi:HAD family hydrolase [Dactylosporangium darangshiense]|uniref:HAD-IA family hydrolase n=1 Tax=Dactylosporangium darangshiense TaxID=579108 RepID=A0ABP8D4C6_9ACTN
MKHLVWDWNGTLLDDLKLVVDATNVCLATVGGPVITADDHRRDFRRPILDYYAHVLERPVEQVEFQLLDDAFHDAYRQRIDEVRLVPDALEAMERWTGTQSLLSMFFHDELLVEVERHGIGARLVRVDGLPGTVGGHKKAEYLRRHLDALALDPADVVLVGDSVDDGEAARTVGASAVLYAGGFTDTALLRATGLPVAFSLVEAVDLALQIGEHR